MPINAFCSFGKKSRLNPHVDVLFLILDHALLIKLQDPYILIQVLASRRVCPRFQVHGSLPLLDIFDDLIHSETEISEGRDDGLELRTIGLVGLRGILEGVGKDGSLAAWVAEGNYVRNGHGVEGVYERVGGFTLGR